MGSIIVGLDIGTSAIRAVIGEVTENNRYGVEIIGYAKKPSRGLRNGSIVNIDEAMSAISETVAEAEMEAGAEVSSVYASIGGSQIDSFNETGQIGVDATSRNREMEINENAKKRAIEAAQAVSIPLGKTLIHTIPQDYIVDGVSEVKNPLGMSAVRLVVRCHLVLASQTLITNVEQCLLRAGLELEDVMLKTLAAASATVHEDEMELGSILIDLGGGTTDVIVLNKGAPVFTVSIPVGGNLVTNDIAVMKGISNSMAEKIKIEEGCCWMDENDMDGEVIIPGFGGRPPEQTTKSELCAIIQPRVEEIFTLARREVVRRSGLKQLNGSIVLTGAGASMKGIVQLAQDVWGTESVRIGTCPDLGGQKKGYRDAEYATGVGLVMNAYASGERSRGKKKGSRSSSEGSVKPVDKFLSFFKKFF